MNRRIPSMSAGALVLAAGLATFALSQTGCDDMNARQTSDADGPASRSTTSPAGTRTQRTGRETPTTREQQRREYEQEAADLQAGLDSMNARQARGGANDADAPIEMPPREILPAARRMTTGGRGGGDRDGDWNSATGRTPQTQPLEAPADRGASLAQTPAANRPASVPDSSSAGMSGGGGGGGGAGRTPEQRRADAVAELAAQLRPDIGGAKDPLRSAMPIIGLELISPGAGAQYLDAMKRAVGPGQRRSLDSAFALARSMATDPNVTAGNPADVAQALRAEADRLAGPQATATDTLGLGEVAICQRVDGFGRFTPLGSSAFFAGRSAAMILYTEIENFSQTSGAETPGSAGGAGGGGGDAAKWNVELGQTVRLYLNADGSEQMVLPETLVRDSSRSKRHDFFLVQRIDLPRTLTVGDYTLKVTVRDAGGGGGPAGSAAGAIAERMVPIRIIADASAAGAGSQRGAGSTTTLPTGSTGQPSQPGRRGTVADRRP